MRTERERLRTRLSASQRASAAELQSTLRDWRTPSRFEDLGQEFVRRAEVLRTTLDNSLFVVLNRLLVIELTLRLPERVAERNMPDEILALYPDALLRLAERIGQREDQMYFYPNDFFLKDLRFAGGLTVPAGAQVVDLRSVIGYRASLHYFLRGAVSGREFRKVGLTHPQPWFRIHTETRYLDEFNEAGWDMCYRRIAALLVRHADVRGLVGTSWFYDPQLETVSPHLAYLRKRPLERGAFLVRNGTTDYDIRSATAKSATRKRLHDAGKYTPVSYTLLWPREALDEWARRHAAVPA